MGIKETLPAPSSSLKAGLDACYLSLYNT